MSGLEVPVSRSQSPLMKSDEVADLFHVKPSTVKKWAKAGKLTAVMTPGGQHRFRRADVEALLTVAPVESKASA